MQASSTSADGQTAMPSFKAQFKRADASGAKFALVFGADELAADSVAIKPMQGGAQIQMPLNDIPAIAVFLMH